MLDSRGLWPALLLGLGATVRTKLISSRAGGLNLEAMATPVAQEGGDTIFQIDRHVEDVVQQKISTWPEACLPLELVMEGLGETGTRRVGPARGDLKYRLIIDPIDGTRNIMYDKRSAWFLAAVCPVRRTDGRAATLADALAAVMVELPPSKQLLADIFAAERGGALSAMRVNLESRQELPLEVKPSQAMTLRNGFGQVSNFFPGTKVLAATLMERIVKSTLGAVEPGTASVFEDQYITTGGQMVELMLGRDRFCCDLRPLFYAALRGGGPVTAPGLECHPYDVAGALVAAAAGVILTDGFGRPLDAPLDVHTGVHWCGYANVELQRQISPVISQWLGEHGVLPSA